MKKRYPQLFLFLTALLSAVFSFGQCPPGYSASQLNWDYLDYFTTTGSYSGFVPNAIASKQFFAMGPNRLSITAATGAFTLGGENTTHTGDLPNFTGNDVQYTPTRNGDSVVITFDNEVRNLSLALYDVDNLAAYAITARDAAGNPVGLSILLQAGSILTVGGVPTARTVSANATALANNSNAGSAIIVPAVAGALVATVKIVVNGRGADPVFWLSDINACVTGSFPNNWRSISRPFTGQAAYIITVVDSQFLLLDPATGYAKPFFKDAGNNSVNGVAYDPVNRAVYYVYNRSGPGGAINPNNKTIRRYWVDAEVIDTAVLDVTASLGIPTFDNGVESAAASFHGGFYYFGIEGYNAARNSGRENTIWRIEFDAAANATRASQVYSARADSFWNSRDRLLHDWSDIAVSNNGIMYDFNGAAGAEIYYHFNLMTGQRQGFLPSGPGTNRPTQTGVDWAENVFNAGNGGGLSGTGFVVPYNYNGTVNSAQEYPVYTLPGPTYPSGNWSDCGEAIRPLCDFGDAPASYDPDPWSPAVHEKDTAIRLGPTWDREWLKMTPMDATGDGSDEDGLTIIPPFFTGAGNYLTQVSVYNNTGETARVIAWLDFNGNGIFDAIEACQAVAPIPSMASMQTVNLFWPSAPSTLPFGSFTYLRIRLVKTSAGMTAARATGYYDHGETEDYRIPVQSFALPVDLLSFEAKALNNNAVSLSWKTSNEDGLNHFVIERSADNSNWTPLQQKGAKGNVAAVNEYDAFDAQPLPGRSYYRLKLVDNTGRYTYSELRSVQLRKVLEAVGILPNPAKHATTLSIASVNTELVQIRLTDMAGRTVLHQSEKLQQGANIIELSLQGLAAGTYVLVLQMNDGRVTRKLVVQ
jgi:hypothetical protein